MYEISRDVIAFPGSLLIDVHVDFTSLSTKTIDPNLKVSQVNIGIRKKLLK